MKLGDERRSEARADASPTLTLPLPLTLTLTLTRRAAASFLPAEFAASVQFMYRPEAEERLERMFGRRVL